MLSCKYFVAILCSAAGILSPADSFAVAPNSLKQTHTQHTHKLKPIPDSFQVAAATFLPDWIDHLGVFSSPSGLDFSETADNSKIFSNCVLRGFNRTSCKDGDYPADFCPVSSLYFKNCLSSVQICLKSGFIETCEKGYVKNPDAICPQNPAYGSCIPNPCTGFDYTLSEATAPGYLVGEECLSGKDKKYVRSANPCPGFGFEATNCGIGARCEKLEGLSCLSGEVMKFAECNPCPVPACSLPAVNIESYYCEGALRCLVP